MASTTPPERDDAAKIAASFNARVAEVKISKAQINSIIMDYLVTEGYPKAAQDFAREANIQPGGDVDTLEARRQIKLSIYGGKIKEAIEFINELNPTILENDQALHFALLRLELVELIKAYNASDGKDMTPVLTFAQEKMAPVAPTNPQFLNDLEQTMTLMIFGDGPINPALEAIVDPQLRVDVAKQVNEAILKANGEAPGARLDELLKTHVWAHAEALRMGKAVPEKIDIGLEDRAGGAMEEDKEEVKEGEAEAEAEAEADEDKMAE